jgi:hypothetical protein
VVSFKNIVGGALIILSAAVSGFFEVGGRGFPTIASTNLFDAAVVFLFVLLGCVLTAAVGGDESPAEVALSPLSCCCPEHRAPPPQTSHKVLLGRRLLAFVAFVVILIATVGAPPFPALGATVTCLGPAFSSNSEGDGPGGSGNDHWGMNFPSFFSASSGFAPMEEVDEAETTTSPLHLIRPTSSSSSSSSSSSGSGAPPKKRRAQQTSMPLPATFLWNSDLVNDIAVKNSLLEYSCCSKCSNSSSSKNCILEAFSSAEDGTSDYEKTVRFVRHMRRNIDSKGKEDIKLQVRIIMEAVTKPGRGNASLPNDYTFFFDGVDRKLCMESFCWLMKVSENFIKSTSTALRKGKEPVVKKSGNKYDNETFFADISYADAVHMFEDWAGLSAGIIYI